MTAKLRYHCVVITAMAILAALAYLTSQETLLRSSSRVNGVPVSNALIDPPYLTEKPPMDDGFDTSAILEPRRLAEQPHGCRINERSRCINMNDASVKRCPEGELFVGRLSGCDPKDLTFGDPLCCPVTRSPKSCTWRGQESDGHTYNGQCHEGEVALLQSPFGGGYNSTMPLKRCDGGSKIFCCQSGRWSQLQQQCYYGDCSRGCDNGDISVASIPDPRCGKKNEVLQIIDPRLLLQGADQIQELSLGRHWEML
ncbi:hypothetical protein BST61_g10461 [Cercospora zeina]